MKDRLPGPDLRPGASRIAIALLIVSHSLALATPWLSAIPISLVVFLDLLVLISLWYNWRRQVLRKSAGAVQRAWCAPDGEWWLLLGDGQELPAKLLPSSLSRPWLVVLQFRLERWQRRNLWLWPDSVAAQTHRRLRVWLKTQYREQPAQADS